MQFCFRSEDSESSGSVAITSFSRSGSNDFGDAHEEPRCSSHESMLTDITDDGLGNGESCMCLAYVTTWTIRCSRCVLIFWLVVSIACIPFAARFTEVLKISLDPTPGTQSESAQRMFEEYIPGVGNKANYVGYLEVASGSILDLPGIDNFTRELQRNLNASRPLSQFLSVTTYNDLVAPLGDAAPAMPVPLHSKDKTAMLITWQIPEDPASKDAMGWAHRSHDIFVNLVKARLGDAIIHRGTDSYSQVAGQSIATVRADMERTDLFAIPLTTLVFLFVVESWRLLLIAGLTMGVSACVSFATTCIVGYIIPVQAITPSIMMCLVICMSIDYAIFLMTRFREEVSIEILGDSDTEVEGESLHKAICSTMATSGATIVLSGSVLFVGFLFLTCFPVAIVASIGIGSCITMVVMIVVNLTLVPALLAEFPCFFTRNLMRPLPCNPFNGCSSSKTNQRSCWRWLATATTSFPCNAIILLVVVVVSAAFSYPVLSMRINADMGQIVALDTNLGIVSDRITKKFGDGLAYPFEVLMVPTDPAVQVLSSDFFEKSGNLIKAVKEDISTSFPDAHGIAYNFISYQTGTGSVPFDTLDAMCQIQDTIAPSTQPTRQLQSMDDFAPLCSFFVDSTTNSDNFRKVAPTAGYGIIMANSIHPLSMEGKLVYDALVDSFARHGPKYGIKTAIYGTPVCILDMVAVLYRTLPIAGAATLATAALFLAVTFRSVIIPIRSILSNCLTLGVSYGLAVLVYQDGWIDFLGYVQVSSKYNALPWFSPIVSFFIMTGIGLDYDIFVLVRITEFRAKGKDPQQAIQEGLVSTGGIITAAGLVMVIAFSGMLLSALVQPAMFGFMMMTAVIYDTFVARCLVVPTAMSLLGHWNWWPSALSEYGLSSRSSHKGDSESLVSFSSTQSKQYRFVDVEAE